MRQNIRVFLTVFLIQLVATIPFYTSSVYAAINKVAVKGNDGIEGFARAEDALNFIVEAGIPDAAVASEQVVLGSNIKFDECRTLENGLAECTLRFPSNGTESFDLMTIPFTINLFSEDKKLEDTKSGNFTIDEKSPEIRLSSMQRFSSQQNIVINYAANDYACNEPSCTGKCVGIKKIEFYTLDGSFSQVIDSAANDCTIKSNISIDIKKFNEGKNAVFARVTDRFNHISQEMSASFIVDTTPPSILPNTFTIMRKGLTISSFSSYPSYPVEVDIFVDVIGDDLNFSSVTADLSTLNPAQGLKNTKASCTTLQNGINRCRWSIDLEPKDGGMKNIAVNAADTSGNKESIVISKLLSADNNGPSVQMLATPSTAKGAALAKSKDNQVISIFDEDSGLSPDEVFLHIGNKYKIKADNCSRDSDWVCVWKGVSFSSDTKMYIGEDTTDIVGNSVIRDFITAVTVDMNSPILNIINISPLGGLVPAFPGFLKIGDRIAVFANLTDENEISAVADFSRFITDAVKVDGSCEKTHGNERVCTWLTDPVNLEAEGFVTFNFTDSAGNALIATKSLKSFGIENTTVPDFWSTSLQCSPKTLDRALGPLINQRVFCQANLIPKQASNRISTVFIGSASCTGDVSFVQNVETLNSQADSTSPIIKLTLKKNEFRIDSAALGCSFDIFSKIGDSLITKNPEIENLRINLTFFDSPLGELSSQVQKKIDDAKDDAQGIWKMIGTLNKLMFYAKRICQIINIFYNVVAIMYNIAIILTIVDAASDKIPEPLHLFSIKKMAISTCGQEAKLRESAELSNNALNKFCAFVNCKQAYLWGPLAQELINENLGSYIGGKKELDKEKTFLGFPTYKREVKDSTDQKINVQTKKYAQEGDIKTIGFSKPLSDYMNPNNNLIVATLFGCLPGVIYGLDKFRQIKCLYADCLENAVGREGLPPFVCEDLKSFTTCKYVTSEIFAVFPWTALFDHFMGLVKNAASNPFTAFGVAIGGYCWAVCKNWIAEARLGAYTLCETAKLFNQVANVAQDVRNMVDEGFKIRQDYCSRIDDKKDKDKSSEEKNKK